MSVFRDADHFYECVGGLMDQAKMDPKIASKIAKSGLVIQFRYTDPEATTTINAKDAPRQPGALMDVIHGPCDLKPDISMRMKADIAHQFWHGKVNLMAAISRKQIVVDGPITKVLKLLPAVQPMYKMYPVLLKEKGYEEMILK
jgi:putative sterol carrier protein